MAEPGHDNLLWCRTLIGALAASGATHAVISPGSRSTPLALACLRQDGLKTWVRVDERCAAFFALGLAKASGLPVILVATSGSAPANWYPAVIEADMGGVPLILLSADRPPELRDCGANQTIDQIRLFGGHARAFHELPPADARPDMLRWLGALAARAAEQSRWPRPGPVHVNVPLREPLLAAEPALRVQAVPPACVPGLPVVNLADDEVAALARELAGGRGVIVCGEGRHGADFPAALGGLARRLACPVFADPLSGLRFGAHDLERVLARYDAFLRGAGLPRPDWVLRFGAMPVSKSLQTWLAGLAEVPQLVVDATGSWPDPLHLAGRMLRADPALLCAGLARRARAAPTAWLETWQEAERRAARLAAIDPPPEAGMIRDIVRLLPDGATLFSGNSMAIRDLDAYSGTGGGTLRIVGNRGASGIDGNVSTALGLAAGGGPLLALLGDLAFYHDMNGLEAARGMDAVFVVLNNGGGGIFEYLPQAGLAEFEQAWLTPLDLDFSHAAALYGLTHHRVKALAAFAPALESALKGGAHLIEVMVDRADSVRRHRAYWSAIV